MTEAKNKHLTTKLNYRNREVEIDTDIVDLIKEIWQAGIATSQSCESHESKHKIWIRMCGM